MNAVLDHLFSNPQQLARIRAEAAFGMGEINDALDSLVPGSRVLEIGCGTGYLLAQAAARYPHLNFSGLEPIGPGFEQFENTLRVIEDNSPNVAVSRCSIEDFTLSEQQRAFDFIFSVNVFEHLKCWRRGIDSAMHALARDGNLMILCPNYAFPYEPHFGLPLILGHKATRVIFAKKIAAIEEELDAAGLWESLNFITAPAVTKHCDASGWQVKYDQRITGRMFDRLGSDTEFSRRQGLLASILLWPSRAGLGKVITKLPASILPYMKVCVAHSHNVKWDG